jgi:hypothetical protein
LFTKRVDSYSTETIHDVKTLKSKLKAIDRSVKESITLGETIFTFYNYKISSEKPLALFITSKIKWLKDGGRVDWQNKNDDVVIFKKLFSWLMFASVMARE